MYLAVCTIQRNNAEKIREWIVYHSLVGVSHFYYMAHMCEDNTKEVLEQLISEGYNIIYCEVNDLLQWYTCQIQFYNQIYNNFGHNHKWMAFIDADEFLVPVKKENNLIDILQKYEEKKLSALGVYWVCYGTSGHILEPSGLVIENYKYRMKYNHQLPNHYTHVPNKHIKSIVKCGLQNVECYPGNMHIFQTPDGTFDELLRPFDLEKPYWFYDYDREPSHTEIRINHYATMSLESSIKKARFRINAYSANFNIQSETEWIRNFDINDEYDDIMDRFVPLVKEKML